MPADDRVVCTMIYGFARKIVELGDGLVPGESYFVRINGELKLAFTAR